MPVKVGGMVLTFARKGLPLTRTERHPNSMEIPLGRTERALIEHRATLLRAPSVTPIA